MCVAIALDDMVNCKYANCNGFQLSDWISLQKVDQFPVAFITIAIENKFYDRCNDVISHLMPSFHSLVHLGNIIYFMP